MMMKKNIKGLKYKIGIIVCITGIILTVLGLLDLVGGFSTLVKLLGVLTLVIGAIIMYPEARKIDEYRNRIRENK